MLPSVRSRMTAKKEYFSTDGMFCGLFISRKQSFTRIHPKRFSFPKTGERIIDWGRKNPASVTVCRVFVLFSVIGIVRIVVAVAAHFLLAVGVILILLRFFRAAASFFLQLFLSDKEKVDRSPFQRERTKPRRHTKKQVNRFPKGSNFL